MEKKVLELDPSQVQQMDLIITRRKLVDVEEQKLMLEMKMLTNKLEQLQRDKLLRAREEAVFTNILAQNLGVPRVHNVKVIGSNKISYEV